MTRLLLTLTAILAVAFAIGQGATQIPEATHTDVFGSSSCMGCHGTSAMGGLGPPLAQTKITDEDFAKTVREGKGMMPATPVDQLSDADMAALLAEVRGKPWVAEEIPLAFKVGSMLTTRNVARLFMIVGLFSLVFIVRSIWYWVGLAGLKYMRPALKKFGVGKAVGVFLKAFFIEGLLVTSLYKKDKHRWFMHGLMLYGMVGLVLADILIQIFNPTRADMALSNPLKVLPIVSGLAVLAGCVYVMFRYKTDPFIDNGVTLGKDYLFLTFLTHAALSGILTLVINRTTAYQWVMPIYIYHLTVVATLIVSAPFTRFQHAWVAPTMLALTRVTEAVTESGVELGFSREPAPGRHHKSQRIAEGVLAQIEQEEEKVVLRYFP